VGNCVTILGMQSAPAHSVLVQLGKRIRALREQRGISQETLADLADIHRNYMSQIETGKRNLSFFNVVKLARALKVTPSKLLEPIR
jgi:transcriptional regulator with XRE-family HTH domain